MVTHRKWSKVDLSRTRGAFLLKFKIWVGVILVHISNEFEAMNISYCFGTYVSMHEFSVSDVFPKPFYIPLPVQTE